MSWTIKIIGLFFIIVANGLFRLGIVNTVLHFSGGRVKTPNINNKKLVVRSCVDVQRVFVFLRKRAL